MDVRIAVRFLLAAEVGVFALAGSITAQPAPSTRPAEMLPPGCVMSLGSHRFRTGEVVRALIFSRDGKVLISLHPSGAMRFWDVGSGSLWGMAAPPAGAGAITGWGLTPDGQALITAHGNRLNFWSISSMSLLRALDLPKADPFTSLGFSRDGAMMVAIGKKIHLLNCRSGQFTDSIDVAPKDAVHAIGFSPDDSKLAVSFGKELRIFDLERRQVLGRIPQEKDPARRISWSADGRRLAASGSALRIYDAATGKQDAAAISDELARLTCHSMAFSPKGNTLAAALGSNGVTLLNIDGGENAFVKISVASGIVMLWSPDGKLLATATGCQIGLWDASTGQSVIKEEEFGAVAAVSASPDGKVIMTAGGRVNFWESQTGKRIVPTTQPSEDEATTRPTATPFDSDATGCLWASYSPDGTTLIVRDRKGVGVWDAKTLTSRRAVAEAAGLPLSIAADGRVMAVCSGKELVFWDLESGKSTGKLAMPQAATEVAMSPDGQGVATLHGGIVSIWDVGSGKALYQINSGDKQAACLRGTPDGRFLALGGTGTRLWHAPSGRPVWSMQIPSKAIFISRSGHLMALCANGQVMIVETATGAPLATLAGGHDGDVVSLAFSPDGMRVITAGADARALVWDLRLVLLPPKIDKSKPLPAETTWNQLAARDAAAAHRTAALLVERADEAVRIMATRLKPSDDPLRTSRAMWVLECIGTPQASKAMDHLSKDARLAGDVKAAQARMALRYPTEPAP